MTLGEYTIDPFGGELLLFWRTVARPEGRCVALHPDDDATENFAASFHLWSLRGSVEGATFPRAIAYDGEEFKPIAGAPYSCWTWDAQPAPGEDPPVDADGSPLTALFCFSDFAEYQKRTDEPGL